MPSETPTAGEVATAEITFENTTDEPIEDVVVTVDVPGADVLSATVEGGERCTLRDDVARCALGTLDPGEKATVRVRFRPADGGEVAPVVTIRGDGIPTLTRTLGPIRVQPGKSGLLIRKRAGASVAPKGDIVTYRIVVRARRRAASARGVRVCDRPRAGLRLRTVSRGGVLVGGGACWRIGRLAPGATRTLTARARVTGRERRRPQRRARPREQPAAPAHTRRRRARARRPGLPARVRGGRRTACPRRLLSLGRSAS